MNSASLTCFAILAVAPLNAQKAPATPTRPSTPGFPTNNPASTPTNNNPNNNNLPASNTSTVVPRPIYLSGKVVLQDGTPPPDPVRIERICGGNPRPQGYTDTKGRFQFQLDSAFGVEADASDATFNSPGNIPGAPQRVSATSPVARGDLTGCDLRAVLPGYISGSVSLGQHGVFDNPDVGTIVLRRAGNVEGTTISMTSLNAPKDALKAYEKGRDAMRKEKLEDAQKNFSKAVELYPKYAAAWYQLGLLQKGRDSASAENSFNQSITADPKFMGPYVELTLILERSGRWDTALSLSTRAVALNASDFPDMHFYRAVAQYNLHDPEGAEKSVREAIKLDTRRQYAQTEKLLGVILMQKRDMPGAAEHLKKYLEMSPAANDRADVQKQLAAVEQAAVAAAK